MANSYKTLFQGQLPGSVTTQFTVGAAKQWIVKMIGVVNNDSSAHTFQMFLNGTTAAHAIGSTAISIPAGGSFIWDQGLNLTMNAAEFLAAGASSASQLTMTVSGDEVG